MLLAMSDTMEVGEVVSDELEDDELLLEFELEARRVDEVTEVGGVADDDSSELTGEPAASCAPN